MSGPNLYSVVPFTTSFTLAGLGTLCFVRNHSCRIHQLFFFLCISVVAWPFALGVFLNLNDPQQILWWTKSGHITCTVAPAIYLDFVVTLLNLQYLRCLVRFTYIYAAATVLAMLATGLYFKPEIYRYSWGPYAKANVLATVDGVFGCFIVLISFGLLFRALRQERRHGSSADYSRLRYIAVALGFFSFALIDYLPKYGIPIPPIGSLFILAFAAIVTYAIVKHQILDFTVAIRRTAIYSILAGLITATYLVAVLIMEKWFQGFFGYRSLIVTSVVSFAIAFGFVPLKNAVQVFEPVS